MNEFEHLANIGEFKEVVLEAMRKQLQENMSVPPTAFIYVAKNNIGQVHALYADDMLEEGEFFEGAAKTRFISLLKTGIDTMRSEGLDVRYYIFVSEAWIVADPVDEFRSRGENPLKPSERPDKIEVLIMIVEGETFHDLFVYTLDKKPDIIPWDLAPGAKSALGGGNFTSILYKGEIHKP